MIVKVNNVLSTRDTKQNITSLGWTDKFHEVLLSLRCISEKQARTRLDKRQSWSQELT